jgi:tetratricopeptide (TPR) repeat protein
MTTRRWRVIPVVGLLLVGVAGCATRTAPASSMRPATAADLPMLEVPATLTVSAGVRAQFDEAWARLQAGDLTAAASRFEAVVQGVPGFYPALAGRGFVALQAGEPQVAAGWFDRALAGNPVYEPALQGRVDATAAVGLDADVLPWLARWSEAAPQREDVRDRLDVLRLRVVQTALSTAAGHRDAGRLAEAEAAVVAAQRVMPQSAILLRELALVEVARGAFDGAEGHVRQAIALDGQDAENHAVLGEILEAQGRLREAAVAYASAAQRDPRSEWTQRSEQLAARAAFAALPAEYRAVPSASTITRAHVAAVLGIRLEAAIARAPRRTAVVLTDVRGHWAAPWILAVTRAGLMDGYPNHTFVPAGVVRRADLAQTVWQVAEVLGAGRARDLAAWRRARPALADLPMSHLAYEAVAATLAAGILTESSPGRFEPARPATGSELMAAIARLEQIAQGPLSLRPVSRRQ